MNRRRTQRWLSRVEAAGLSADQTRRFSRRLGGALRRELALAARRNRPQSLLDWARHYLAEHFTQPPSQMHRWLDEQVGRFAAARGTKLNVIGPRGGAKSTVVTLAYVLRVAVERQEPYIWIVSDTRRQARGHLDNLRHELLANPLLARDYPGAAGRTKTWRDETLRLANGVLIEAYGTGQRVRGRRDGAHRPTLVVCDDVQNDGHMLSATLRQRSRDWFHGTLLKAGTHRTNVVNLATALHRDALAPELHRAAGWQSRVFSAIVRWPDNMALWQKWEQLYTDLDNPRRGEQARAFYDQHAEAMHAGCELLWPEEEGLYTLMTMRVESGPTAFEREKQGRPINPDLCEWPAACFEGPLWFDRWPRETRIKTMAVDPSKGHDARRGDYSAIVSLAIDAAGALYVDADLARRPTGQLVADVVERYRQFRPQALAIETNQYQELLCGELAAEFCRQGLVDVAPWSIDNRVNKQVRIRRLGPYLTSGRLRFARRSAGAQLLVRQLQDFPLGDHDDGPDALEMALRLAGELLAPSNTNPDGLGDRLPLSRW